MSVFEEAWFSHW